MLALLGVSGRRRVNGTCRSRLAKPLEWFICRFLLSSVGSFPLSCDFFCSLLVVGRRLLLWSVHSVSTVFNSLLLPYICSEYGAQRTAVYQYDQHVKKQEEEDEKEGQKEGGVTGKAAPAIGGAGRESPD